MMTDGTSLSGLTVQQVESGFRKLEEAGITRDRWFALFDADAAALDELLKTWPSDSVALQRPSGAGVVYDARKVSQLLGLEAKATGSAPQAHGDEIVVYYGGWDTRQLLTSAAGKQWVELEQSPEYTRKVLHPVEPGYYRVLLPVPGSNKKSWAEQCDRLSAVDPDWVPAPICVALTALLARLMAGGDNTFHGNRYRCAEVHRQHSVKRSTHWYLSVSKNRVEISSRCHDVSRQDHTWLAAAQKS